MGQSIIDLRMASVQVVDSWLIIGTLVHYMHSFHLAQFVNELWHMTLTLTSGIQMISTQKMKTRGELDILSVSYNSICITWSIIGCLCYKKPVYYYLKYINEFRYLHSLHKNGKIK